MRASKSLALVLAALGVALSVWSVARDASPLTCAVLAFTSLIFVAVVVLVGAKP